MIKLVQYHFVPYIFVYQAKFEIQFNSHQVPPSLILSVLAAFSSLAVNNLLSSILWWPYTCTSSPTEKNRNLI